MSPEVQKKTASRTTHEEPSFKELFAFSAANTGSVTPDFLVSSLALQIMNIVLGLNPALVASVLMARGILDAVTDPIMGYVSDNTSTRWGRRRPYIFVGSILLGVMSVGLWFFDKSWSESAIVAYFGVFLIAVALSSTIYGVPYQALSFEMSATYHGRTRVQVFRAYCSKVMQLTHPWFLTFALLPVFDGGLGGIRTLSVVCALVVIGSGVGAALLVKERAQVVQVRENFFKAFWGVARNSEFRRVASVFVLMMFLLGVFNVYGSYLAIYYVFGGDKAVGAAFYSGVGSLGGVCGFLAVPFAYWLCKRVEKHKALMICTASMGIGCGMNWWVVTPAAPWLMYTSQPFFALGIAALFVILASLQADVIDYDELKSGRRREGLFGASTTFFTKFAYALATGVTGLLLNYTGFDAALGGEQSERTFTLLRGFYAFGPVVIACLCIAVLWKYSLTEARVREIQDEIAERRSSVAEGSGVDGEG